MTHPKLFAVTLYFNALTDGRRRRRQDYRRDFAVLADDTHNAIAKAWNVLAQGEFSARGAVPYHETETHTAQEISLGVISIA